jgi:glycosyltransferase involved in cell wall biosynthesis
MNKELKIAFNATAMTPPHAGISHYCRNVFEHLYCHPAVAEVNSFSGFRWLETGWKPQQGDFSASEPGLSRSIAKRIPGARRLVRSLRDYRFLSQLQHLDNNVYFEPNYIPVSCGLPTVPVVHDLSHLHYPQFHPANRVKWLEDNLSGVLECAPKVLTVSHFSKQEICGHFGLDSDKIVVAEPGVEPSFFDVDNEQAAAVLKHYKLKPGYLLAVGTMEPRKNLAGLAKAFAALPVRVRTDHPLVVIGAKGWLSDEIEKLLSPMERAAEVIRLGYVAQKDLPFLYAGAAGFAYPSFYEGFGMPLLEAMAGGIPVLTSNRASMPEVVGDVGLLIDPEDIHTMSNALEKLLGDSSFRALARERGIIRARQFTWNRTVDIIVDTLISARACSVTLSER